MPRIERCARPSLPGQIPRGAPSFWIDEKEEKWSCLVEGNSRGGHACSVNWAKRSNCSPSSFLSIAMVILTVWLPGNLLINYLVFFVLGPEDVIGVMRGLDCAVIVEGADTTEARRRSARED